MTGSSCASACLNLSSSYQSLLEFALAWNSSEFKSVLSTPTAFQLIPYAPETFLDRALVYLIPVTPGAKTRYRLECAASSSPWIDSSRVEVTTSCAHLEAISFLPGPETSSEFLSDTAQVTVEIKTPPPVIKVTQCAILKANVTEMLEFDGITSNYSDQSCSYLVVDILAQGLLNATARIRYAENQVTGSLVMTDQAIGRATLTMLESGVVAALAFRPGTTPSDPVFSPRFVVSPAPVRSFDWMGTIGLWNFSLESLQGTYEREVNPLNGCAEVQPTVIHPSQVRDASNLLGAAVLKGPACKSGTWDLPAPFSPSISSFLVNKISDGSSLQGLQFNSLNSELFVRNDLSQAHAAGLLPTETLSLEVWFSINPAGSIPVAGLVSARSDGPELAGHRYGKGWSLSYSVEDELDETRIEFAIATQKQELISGLGGFATLVGRVSPRLPAVSQVSRD